MILPTTFQVNWPFSSGAEVHYCHLGFPSGVILAFLDLQVALTFPTKFRVKWPFSSEDKGQNKFSRWWPSWISYGKDFSYF